MLRAGLLGGLVGSLVDSLLGATVQFSGLNTTTQKVTGRPGPDVHRIAGHPLLSNNGVNLGSASITAALTACLVLIMLPGSAMLNRFGLRALQLGVKGIAV